MNCFLYKHYTRVLMRIPTKVSLRNNRRQQHTRGLSCAADTSLYSGIKACLFLVHFFRGIWLNVVGLGDIAGVEHLILRRRTILAVRPFRVLSLSAWEVTPLVPGQNINDRHER